MPSDAARENFLNKIAALVAAGRVMPVLGAGVSRAAADLPGWKGIIEGGIAYLEMRGVQDDEALREVQDLLTGPDLIAAAEKLSQLLGAPHGEYPSWLNETFARTRTQVTAPGLIDSVVALGCSLIATTNYDRLVTTLYSSLNDVTWTHPQQMLAALQKGGAVLHLHGDYADPASVVFGKDDYSRLGADQAYHDVLKVLWMDRALLFIGCSFDGVTDPDFTRFLTWATQTFPGSSHTHYALIQDGESGTEPEKVRSLLYDRRIQVVKTGLDFGDLPIWLHELRERAQALRGAAPPAEKTNLPNRDVELVGRAAETAAVGDLLLKNHLVTLTGAGGCGKTSLGVRVGWDVLSRYPDGVWIARLDALSDPALVPQMVASVLGVREEPGTPILPALLTALRSLNLLLVLDNCEHLLAACKELCQEIVNACPNVRILATSRNPLAAPRWRQYPVLPLAVPASGTSLSPEEMSRYSAVGLFVARVQDADPVFVVTAENAAAVGEICRRLDGIPLALELAAARVYSLSVEDVRRLLNERFALLTHGDSKLARQQTMEASVRWSYDLLSDAEKMMLGRLSVFAGGWTREAAESVVTGAGIEAGAFLDLLTFLVENSLIVADHQGTEVRYRMLETIREYAHDRLKESGTAEAVQDRHLGWCLQLVEDADGSMIGLDQAIWLNRLETEHDNLRAALAWCEKEREVDDGLYLSGMLGHFWWTRGHWSEGRRWFAILLAQTEGLLPSRQWAIALHRAAMLALVQSDYAEAERLNAQSLEMSRALNNPHGIAASLHEQGGIAYKQGEYKKAHGLFKESLDIKRTLKDLRDIAVTLHALANLAYSQGEYEKARELYEENLKMSRTLNDQSGIAASLNGLGGVASSQGEYEKAQGLYDESLGIKRTLKDPRGIAFTLHEQGKNASIQRDYDKAQRLFEECLGIKRTLNDLHSIALTLNALGIVMYKQGNYEKAEGLHEESLSIRRTLNDPQAIAIALHELGVVAFRQGEYEKAQKIFEECLGINRKLGYPRSIGGTLHALGYVARSQGRCLRAAHLGGAAIAWCEGNNLPYDPRWREVFTTPLPASTLSEEALVNAWDAGRAMTLEQAAEYALREE